MAYKSNSDKAYDQGYNAGKNGDFVDDFVHGNKDIIPGPNGRHESSYDGGYNDGHKDRYNSNNDHYQGGGSSGGSGGSSSSGGCFLTTACTTFKGLSDNCSQLETLRKFRDQYVMSKPLGKELIREYYQKAPKVVAAIATRNIESQTKVYDSLFERINYACFLINENNNEAAFNVYSETSKKLFSEFVGN
jgi:hypothetical protein